MLKVSDKKAKEIIKTALEKYAETTGNKVWNLNRGGCGIFAEHLYYVLKKAGLDPKIVIIGGISHLIENSIKHNLSGRDLEFTHIVLRVNGYYVDSDAIRTPRAVLAKWRNDCVIEGLTIEQLNSWNKDEYVWNSDFDRSQIKKIEKGFEKINKIINEKLLEMSK